MKRVENNLGKDNRYHRCTSFSCDVCGINFAFMIDSNMAYHVDATDQRNWKYTLEKGYENKLRNAKYCSDKCRKAGDAERKRKAREAEQQKKKNKKNHEKWKMDCENREYGRKTVELTRTKQLNRELQEQINLVKQQNAKLMEELSHGKKS